MMPLHMESTAKIEATRWLAVGALLALIAVCLAWELGHAQSRWAVKALPLCIPLAGLLKRRMYTYRWVSLLVWLYFLEGVLRVADRPPVSYFASAEIALSLLLFAACAAHVRIRLKSAHDPAA